MQVLVSRTGYTAELGYEIYLFDASRRGDRLWELVLEAGRPHGLTVIGPCHIRRIEGGILAYGADMWLDTNPYEVGMGYDWMVDLEQEATSSASRRSRGSSRRARRGSSPAWRSTGRAWAPTTTARWSMCFPVHHDGRARSAA